MCLGIPGQIVAITSPEKKLATVNVGGVKREVNIACIVDEAHLPENCVGDWVLVHVGFAMNRIDETEAAATLDLLQQLAETTSNRS
jgi:hydrogenase expression/formation protein HypC